MKKLLLVCLLSLAFVQVSKATTESERYWAYVLASLKSLQNNGVYVGQIYESDPRNGKPENGWCANFAERFGVGFTARAVVDCSPGWYGAWAEWRNSRSDCLFYSSTEETYIRPGPQVLPLAMMVNPYPVIRFEIKEILDPNQEEVWFGGNRAWYDGTSWRTSVYKPWNIVGQPVEVVWSGHGGWRVTLNQSMFGGVINFTTEDIDTSITAPTKLKTISFLGDGSYLEGEPVKYLSRYYNEEFGCVVLEFESTFDGSMKDFIIELNGYDQYSGKRVNYYSTCVEWAEGVFLVQLGDVQILPQTAVKIYLTKPGSDIFYWQWLNTDLWYDLGGGPVKGKQ